MMDKKTYRGFRKKNSILWLIRFVDHHVQYVLTLLKHGINTAAQNRLSANLLILLVKQEKQKFGLISPSTINI